MEAKAEKSEDGDGISLLDNMVFAVFSYQYGT